MNNAIFLSNPGTLIMIVLGVLILLWAYSIYVSLIKKKNKAKEAFSSIDVQLKKRYDLIPNVLFIANKFMEHERGLLDDITRLRAQAAKLPAELSNAEQTLNLDKEITTKMGQLMVNVENYPQLKSDQTMIQAMQTYNEQEEHIAAARRFYNSAVLELNNAVEIFPSSLIASMLNIKQLPFFEVANEAERQAIDASKYFK
ncbi:LemA family protein [Spirochaetes bacterium]|uniref:LemA family protein n=1 Tax=Candidatus Scatousia excrementipullorum TaxID=2840936 RepID=A0A9D9GZX1_9BACT|nr:LemA family protein [Candidatus Scatousia excrementipullorum]